MSTKIDGSTGIDKVADGSITPSKLSPQYLTAALTANVALNNTSLYFDGPSVAQGASGTWLVIAKVTVSDSVGAAAFAAKLWDGATIIDTSVVAQANATYATVLTVSGVITNPVGNIRISIKDLSSTGGSMNYNGSGNGKDCSITALRIG